MLLSNIFSDKFDNFVNSSNNKDVISCRQKKNATNCQIPAIERNEVAGHFGIEKKSCGEKYSCWSF